MFALASSLIVSVFTQKTTPLKTLFYLLNCALRGFDQVRAAEKKEGTTAMVEKKQKKTGHKLRSPFVSVTVSIVRMKLGQNVLCSSNYIPPLCVSPLSINIGLLRQAANINAPEAEYSECYQMAQRKTDSSDKKIQL